MSRNPRLELVGRIGLSAVVAALAWVGPVTASASLDTSWQVGLHMAVHQSLRAGHDWIYTYGPAGFLAYPAWFGTTTGALSVVLNLVLRATFAFVVIRVLRARLPTVLAAAIAYVMLIAWPLESPEMVVLVVAALITVAALKGEHLPVGALCALGAVGGLLATVKLNTAVTVLGVAALLALQTCQVRAIVATGTSAVAAFLGTWMVLGQRLGDVSSYFRNGLQVVAGYSEASATELPGLRWHYLAAVTITAALCVAAWAMPRRHRSGVFAVAVLGWIGYNTARHAFVRHDGHALGFFAVAAVIGIGVASVQSRGRATVAALAVAASLVVSGQIRPLDGLLTPHHNARRALTDLRFALTNSREPVEQQRAQARAAISPGARIIRAAHDRGVHVAPFGAVVAFAYGERWDPLPSFQDLLTYTPALDDRNVERIDAGGPRYVLLDVAPPTYDYRLADFNAPRTRLALLCHYELQERARGWKLLQRLPASTCGHEEVLGRAEVHPSVPISVPPPRHGGAVVARFTLPPPTVRHKLLVMLWKPLSHPSIAVNGVSYRWLAAQADGPFLLSVPASAPFGPGVDGAAIQTLAVSGFGAASANVEFDEVPLGR